MAAPAVEFFNANTLSRDLFDLVTGEMLGEGISRQVFRFAPEPGLVIKFEGGARSFQNVSEWETWTWVQGNPMEKWFAPCVSISACGSVLLQKYVEPIRMTERPPRLPAYLCDLKRENFGVLGDRIVCCDYGLVASAIRTVPRTMKRAEWND